MFNFRMKLMHIPLSFCKICLFANCLQLDRVFWIFLPNVITIDPYNFEPYRFKVGAFLRHDVHMCIVSILISLSHPDTVIDCWCRQLGYVVNNSRLTASPWFWSGDVRCNGTESNFQQCLRGAWRRTSRAGCSNYRYSTISISCRTGGAGFWKL